MSRAKLLPPALLRDDHDLSLFDCGEPSLNDWLIRRARTNQASGGSRTFVLCRAGFVVGYYSLAVGAVAVTLAPGRGRSRIAEPVPVVVLSRLAVDRSLHGQGLGRALLRDALRRTLPAARAIGAGCLLAPAPGEVARQFYLACGLLPAPGDPALLMVTLGGAVAALG